MIFCLSGCMTFGANSGRMHQILKSQTLSVSIKSSSANVYNFVSQPINLPIWAKTFVHSIRQSRGEWEIETAQGMARIRIAPKNDLGILDHTLKFPAGLEVTVPMRVVANGDGCEVLFTVFHQPEMTDEAYAADLKMVEQDLQSLKAWMEQTVDILRK